MTDELAIAAATARTEADRLELLRIDAQQRARDAAAKAHQLESQIEQRELRALEAEFGPPTAAPVSLTESTDAELQAAREAGVLVG